MQPSPTSPTQFVEDAVRVDATQDERNRAFFALTAKQRIAAMWRTLQRADGELPEVNATTLYLWTRRCPNEVPLINGEYAFIAALTPEVAEAPTAGTTGADVRQALHTTTAEQLSRMTAAVISGDTWEFC